MNDRLKKMCDKHSVPLESGMAFYDSLQQHIAYVQEAGRKIGVPEDQLLIHDESKFSEWEFPFYAKYSAYGGSPVDHPDAGVEMAIAWLHHENVNPHHEGYWIPRTGRFANKCLEMPDKYALELVADKMGAGRTYTGTWDMSKWLNENFSKMRLHADTRQKVIQMLEKTGHTLNWGIFEFKAKA